MEEVDLYGNILKEKQVKVNIYADEAMDRKCTYTNTNWHYMCLIFDNFDDSLLEDLIKIRYCNNLDKKSPCFLKNNKILHWTDISSMDEVNICKRWFEYILNPNKSGKKFYCYILGLNESFLNDEEFDASDKFNSIYNRFFRSCISLD